MVKRHRLRRWVTYGSVALLVAGVLACAFAVRMWSLYEAGEDARARLELALTTAQQAGFGLTAGQAGSVTQNLAEADASLAQVQSALEGDPAVRLLRLLPAVDRQAQAAGTLVQAARVLTSRSTEVGSLLTAYVTTRDGNQGLQRVAAFARLAATTRAQTDDLLTAFDASDRLVSGLAPQGLLGPVESVRDELAARIAAARPVVAAGAVLGTVIPSIMGVGGQQRYLVLALDNAELRPIGGLIAAFATPTLTNGLLSDPTFHDVYDVDKADQPTYVAPPPGLAGHLLGNDPWQVADAGWSPDFATSAAAARRLYRVETGAADFQGTIAFTPDMVDALLEVVGPVAIPDAGLTVHAGETYLVSLQQVEILHQGPSRKQFLAELASEVLARVLALPPARYPDVIAALDHAGKRRQLQVLFDDPAVQTAIDGLGWYTPFRFPGTDDRLAVAEANVGPVSKLDALLKLDHVLDVTLQPDGSALERLETTYTNGFGPALPPTLESVRASFRYGILGSYLRRYLVPNARLLGVSSDGHPPLTAPELLGTELGCLVVANYLQIPPGITHLETRYVAPHVVQSPDDPARSGAYRLDVRKQAGRDRDTVTVRVTVPPGAMPVAWSSGGTVDGRTITFTTTTEFDHTFDVTYGPG